MVSHVRDTASAVGLRGGGLLLAVLLLAARPTSAQEPCPEPSWELEVAPASLSRGVRLDAPIRVRYPAGLLADPRVAASARRLRVGHCAAAPCDWESATPLVGGVQLVGDSAFFVPVVPLLPSRWHVAQAFLLDTAQTWTFETGIAEDAREPRVGDLAVVESAPYTGCGLPDGGYRLDVVFSPADDDAPAADLEYFLYLTRGPTVLAPEPRARVRGYGGAELVAAVLLERSEAVSPVCLALAVVDPSGGFDASPEPTCLDPVQGAYFEPLCASTGVRRAPGSHPPLPVAGLALVLVLVRRASPRGRARARGHACPAPRFPSGF
ncbi:MAG: hypothetical protein NZ898_01985 [Myxococcota bacterium]|nr:hypothetical protein [Myxococcota bacterium]MDW8361579.1 hypothetical protein [Myxococcales bacterium]